MFDNLTNRLSKILENIRGQGRFTEKNIKSVVREVRISLLEADVSLVVVNNFINQIRTRIVGNEINKSLTPSQEFIKIVKTELILLMGKNNEYLNTSAQPPIIILITGLQGSGKTTTAAKLAKILKEKDKKKVILTSTDIYRPAAIQQLKNLSKQINVDYYVSNKKTPVKIVEDTIKSLKNKFYDVILIDTAGRLHVDEYMMQEIKKIHLKANPIETIFVVDSMLGQEAANIAKNFNEAVNITGIILTKVDGDARGGSALSISYITKKPIKFICTGEKIDDIEKFYPERIASRILGMGDVFSLIEDVKNKLNVKNKNILSKQIKYKNFNLNDFLDQIKNMQNMGGISNFLSKFPILKKNNNKKYCQNNEKFLLKMEAIINSMTKKERLNPEIIKGSQKKRIASGSGSQIQDINKLLKQFNDMKYIMKKIKKGGITKTINSIKSIINYIR